MSWKKIGKALKKATGLEFAENLWDDFTGKTAVDKQNQYNLQAWEMQNNYNTPANQVERLRAAGLNPNLFYSQGTVGNASSGPDLQAHQGSAARAFELAKIALSLKNMGITNRNLEAQTRNIDAQTAQHWSDVKYKDALIEFYAKHGYFPGQTSAPTNIISEVSRQVQGHPLFTHSAEALGNVVGKVVTLGEQKEYAGRAYDLANKAADKKGLTGEARDWYIYQFVDKYKRYH